MCKSGKFKDYVIDIIVLRIIICVYLLGIFIWLLELNEVFIRFDMDYGYF